MDAIKKDAGDEYKDDNRYLKLMMRNGELKAYEDQLFQVQQFTYAIEDLRERQKLNDSGLSEIYESIHDARRRRIEKIIIKNAVSMRLIWWRKKTIRISMQRNFPIIRRLPTL